jgi:hypothetical protein
MYHRLACLGVVVSCFFALSGAAAAQSILDEPLPGEQLPSAELVRPAVTIEGAPSDFLVPRTSCLAQPWRTDCPHPSSIEYVEGVPGEGSAFVAGLPSEQRALLGVRFPGDEEGQGPADIAPESDFYQAFTSPPTPVVVYGGAISQRSICLACATTTAADPVGSKEKDACALNAQNVVSLHKAKPAAEGDAFAQTRTYHPCESKYASWQEFTVTIQRYRRGNWKNLVAGQGAGTPDLNPNVWGRTITYDCNHYKEFPYRNYSTGYHETYSGKSYVTSAKSDTSMLTCGGVQATL